MRHPLFSPLLLGACIVVASASAQAQSADEPGAGAEPEQGPTSAAPRAPAGGAATADSERSTERSSVNPQSAAGDAGEAEASAAPSSGTAWRLLLTGAAATGAFYGLGYLTAEAWPHHPASPALRIPVVGPWMALPDIGCSNYGGDCGTASAVLQTALIGLSALGQAGGLVLMAEGIYLGLSGGSSPKKQDESAVQPKLYGAPLLTTDGAGLLFGGTF